MSLVSPDSICKCHNGVTNKPKYDNIEKKTDRVEGAKDTNERESNNIIEKSLNKKSYSNVTVLINAKNNEATVKHALDYKKISDIHNTGTNHISKYRNDIFNPESRNILLDSSSAKCINDSGDKACDENNKNDNSYISKKILQKQDDSQIWKKNRASNATKRIKEKYRRRPKWKIPSGILISFVMLNVVGVSSAGDTSTFSSALTSRMIASFLGYPSTCNLGTEVRPCTLTLSCWLRGGTRLRGCGGWLFSCCGLPEPSRETFDNSIPSSEWKYKPPTKLRQVPQRNLLPNNVFRRRVDDDTTQMECGLPSSRILQKRIIGGREARFAEFPWQAHVRISEFQCGGVLVSHRFVATAAHCVSRAHTRDIAVWLGAIDTSATHHPARKLGVIQKILHPLFQFRMTQPDRYDIALLKLSRPITYMPYILPICLPDHDMELRGRSGVIAGWGKTDASNGHTGTNLLRSAIVPILSKEQCINWHQSKQISVEIHSEMICAGHSDGHQDACLGDSGGPLIVLDSGRYYLVGITSAGFGCGVDHQPGIYHNVKLTANWIRSVITPTVSYNDNYLK